MTDFLFDPDLVSSLIVVRTLPAAPLVYKSSDFEVAETSTGDDGDKRESDDDDDDGKDDKKKVDGNAGLLTGAGFLVPW
ncbi:hypothetical protein FSST1_007559 [Fusarium sambucinum]